MLDDFLTLIENWNSGNVLYIQDHHLIKCNTSYSLEKLNTKELYYMLLLLKYVKPTCQNHLERKFDGYNFNWKLIYKLSRIATYDAKIRIFQYKILKGTVMQTKKHWQIINYVFQKYLENFGSILIGIKTRTAMNAKMSVFVISVKVIIYLLKYNLHECTINNMLYMNKNFFILV